MKTKITTSLEEFTIGELSNSDRVALAVAAFEVAYIVQDLDQLLHLNRIVFKYLSIRGDDLPDEDEDYLAAGREDYFDALLMAWRYLGHEAAWRMHPRTKPKLILNGEISLN